MKNKLLYIAAMLELLAVFVLFSGCGNAKSTVDTHFQVKQRGIEFEISQEYQDMGVEAESYNENEKGYKNVFVYYYSPEAKRLLNEIIDMDDAQRTPEVSQAYTQKIWDGSRCLMEVVIVEEETYQQAMAADGKAEDFTYFTPAEYFGTNDGFVYLISIPDLPEDTLSVEDRESYHACKEYMQTVKQNIKFLPVELESDETVVGDAMPVFKTVDLSGNEITDAVFLDKDLTVVNLWGTFCTPCIEEMPELEALHQKYSDRVQVLGIVGDIDGVEDTVHLELAKTITEKAKVTFPNLVANEDFADLISGVIGYPTTIFVDKFGNIIGEPIVGSDISGTEGFIESFLSQN